MPSSRDRFTRADFDFLTSILAVGDKRSHLAKLWEDPDALRELLDLKEVLRGVLDSPAVIQVSPAFYFYVLVRHGFLQAGLTDSDLADYVAGVMARRVASSSGDFLQDVARGYTHAADFIAIISSSHGRMRFHLQVAAGNQFLILTGLYPGFLKRRCERTAAPDLAFYESFARQAYRGAADNPQAPGNTPRQLLGTLSEILPTARLSLNRIAEEFIFLGE
ncbi:hypothetical protein JIN85_16780 [Luteolibacter pohnpeiensis]|uniref:Uncharacterized protein n=1 Tax=Luteolibacter pohnpeiensis TaxID=454153 RepID=A0A934VVY9_9BACT|nr:hypothetical protein [Luteolibacter pohnpeiensis]MBK1884077.1 hypothetical protein [Luteolibacter pohnpeiensis]